MVVKQQSDVEEAVDLARQHGIDPFLLPRAASRSQESDDDRMLREQRDTVAYQWMREYVKIERLSRTCLYCAFLAKSRISLRAHMKKHGCTITVAAPLR